MATRTIRSTCRICHGACDVPAHVEGDRVVKVTGDRIHVVVGGLHLPMTGSRGFRGLPMQWIVGTGLLPVEVLRAGKSFILSAGAPRTSRNGVADPRARERAWNS